MPGYLVKLEQISVQGVADLTIRSLLDRQQFADPAGLAEAVGISSAHWPLFGLLWPSGRHLAVAIAQRPVRQQERILEVGCGLALASLVGHRRGAHMTASDIHPLAEAFLNENLRLNDLPPMPFLTGGWADLRDVHLPPARPFELIMGSDVLYERDDAGVLPHFIARHASAVGEVMIIDPNRGNRSPFHRRMATLGYALTETAIRDPLGLGGPYSGRLLHYRRH
jgi:predicted nicotinamide N-methyase